MAFTEQYDIAVVGAGHAGREAAMAAARERVRVVVVMESSLRCDRRRVSGGADQRDAVYTGSPSIHVEVTRDVWISAGSRSNGLGETTMRFAR